MRQHIAAAGLTGLALISLAACGKPAPGAGNSSSAAGAGAPAAAGPVSVSAFPARKAGLWRQVIAMDGPATGPGFKVCIDAASDAEMSAVRHVPGAKCTPPQMTRNLDGSIAMSDSCDMGASGKTATTGVIKGDFNSSYTVTMDSQTSGSPVPQMNGAHKMTITATWLGPCGPGQKGGDMIFPDGRVRHTMDDQAGAGGGNAAPAAGN